MYTDILKMLREGTQSSERLCDELGVIPYDLRVLMKNLRRIGLDISYKKGYYALTNDFDNVVLSEAERRYVVHLTLQLTKALRLLHDNEVSPLWPNKVIHKDRILLEIELKNGKVYMDSEVKYIVPVVRERLRIAKAITNVATEWRILDKFIGKEVTLDGRKGVYKGVNARGHALVETDGREVIIPPLEAHRLLFPITPKRSFQYP